MGNAINHFIFTIVELTGGILSNSLALLSDSFHMLSDVLARIINAGYLLCKS